MGWLIVCFDLPVEEKEERRLAARFRKDLLDLGYFMLQRRITGLGLFFLAALLGLGCFLSFLMFGQGQELTAAAAAQRLRSIDYYQYGRGDILDRYGRPLVNIEEPCLVVLPAMIRGREEEIASALSRLLDVDAKVLQEHLTAADGSSFQPVVLKTGLTSKQAQDVERAALPGVLTLTLAARYGRTFPASQLIGCVRQTEEGCRGISGLELQYDGLLSGRRDLQVEIAVDAKGSMNGEAVLAQTDEPCSSSLCLTLDRDYQQIAEQALSASGLRGSCVVMEPNSGDILALASWPRLDPYGWENAAGSSWLERALLPYAPASTFKAVLAAAALTEKVIGGNEANGDTGDSESQQAAESGENEDGSVFVCNGSYTLSDGRVVHCAGGQAHGEVDLVRALAVSCNCYFVALGQALGGDKVLTWCRRLGLEQSDILGYRPDYADAELISFDPDQVGELANACLGEAGVQLTPLREAVLFSAFVNGGFLVTPRLVSSCWKRSFTRSSS